MAPNIRHDDLSTQYLHTSIDTVGVPGHKILPYGKYTIQMKKIETTIERTFTSL